MPYFNCGPFKKKRLRGSKEFFRSDSKGKVSKKKTWMMTVLILLVNNSNNNDVKSKK